MTDSDETNEDENVKGKIIKMPIKAVVFMALYITTGALVAYYCKLSYIGLLSAIPFPSAEPNNFGKYTEDVELEHLSVPTSILPTEKDKNKNMCSKIFFDEKKINKELNASFLYTMNDYKPTEYENFGMGVITYPMINYIQRAIILNFKFLGMFFGFINSITSEKTSAIIGLFVAMLFIPIFLFVNFFGTIGCWLWSLKDLFKIPSKKFLENQLKTGGAPDGDAQTDTTTTTDSAPVDATTTPSATPTATPSANDIIDNPVDSLGAISKDPAGAATNIAMDVATNPAELTNLAAAATAKTALLKKNLDMGILGVLYRAIFAFIWLCSWWFMIPFGCTVAGFYSIIKPLNLSSKLNSGANGSKFSFYLMLQNFLKIYRHIYFIAFAVILIVYGSEISSSVGIGLLIATLVIWQATSLFDKAVVPDLPFQGATCSVDSEEDSANAVSTTDAAIPDTATPDTATPDAITGGGSGSGRRSVRGKTIKRK